MNAFWRDHLDVNEAEVKEEVSNDDAVERWLARQSKYSRKIVAAYLGISESLPYDEYLQAILVERGRLMLFFLGERAAKGKKTFLLERVVKERFPEAAYVHCHSSGDKPDRQALVNTICVHDRSLFSDVYHLDRMFRRGFVQMTLAEGDQCSDGAPPVSCSRERIQQILDECHGDEDGGLLGRRPCCIEVVRDSENHMVFVGCDHPVALRSKREKHSLKRGREWFVLDFAPTLRRVYISSWSRDAAVTIANHIASGLLGRDVRYQSRIIVTPLERAISFVRNLMDCPFKLPMIEAVISKSGLIDHSTVTLQKPPDVTVCRDLALFESFQGCVIGDPWRLDSIKFIAMKRPVQVTFEQQNNGGNIVVRYDDDLLFGTEKRDLEHMLEKEYGVMAQSKELNHVA